MAQISGYVFLCSCAYIPEISQMDFTVTGVILGDQQFRVPELSLKISMMVHLRSWHLVLSAQNTLESSCANV